MFLEIIVNTVYFTLFHIFVSNSEVDFLNEIFHVLQKYFSVHKGKLFQS